MLEIEALALANRKPYNDAHADGTFVGNQCCSEMPSQDTRLNELLRTCEAAGRKYIANSLGEAMRSTLTADGSTASKLAEMVAAKAEWDAANLAVVEYQASR